MAPAKRVTAPRVRDMKSAGERIVCLTAYDYFSASLADAAGVDVILVGDSVGNTVLGYSTTIPVTLEDMVHHTAAAARGVKNALLVADLPFGSYQASTQVAVESAVALVKAGASAVKLEGAYTDEIAAIAKAGIPVMGHVGMTPQSVHQFGGFKVQGKGDSSSLVKNAAKAVEEAGVFAYVLELIPADLAGEITEASRVPTIGIGAGPRCDGEIQVFYDVLGLEEMRLKHAKRYVEGRQILQQGLEQYIREVRSGDFPTAEHSL
jgi:3-methyl-2-oxobutanoate hydroxymethyltransferase